MLTASGSPCARARTSALVHAPTRAANEARSAVRAVVRSSAAARRAAPTVRAGPRRRRAEPLPAASPPSTSGVGWTPLEATCGPGSRGRFTPSQHEATVGGEGLLPGHLLLDHGGQQRLQHEPGPGDAPCGCARCKRGDGGVAPGLRARRSRPSAPSIAGRDSSAQAAPLPASEDDAITGPRLEAEGGGTFRGAKARQVMPCSRWKVGSPARRGGAGRGPARRGTASRPPSTSSVTSFPPAVRGPAASFVACYPPVRPAG